MPRQPSIIPGGGTRVDPFKLIAAHNAARAGRTTSAIEGIANLSGGRLESATDQAQMRADILQSLIGAEHLAEQQGGTNVAAMLGQAGAPFGIGVPSAAYGAQQDVLRQDTARAAIVNELAQAAERAGKVGLRIGGPGVTDISGAPTLTEQMTLPQMAAARAPRAPATGPMIEMRTPYGPGGVAVVRGRDRAQVEDLASQLRHTTSGDVGAEDASGKEVSGETGDTTSPRATGVPPESNRLNNSMISAMEQYIAQQGISASYVKSHHMNDGSIVVEYRTANGETLYGMAEDGALVVKKAQ